MFFPVAALEVADYSLLIRFKGNQINALIPGSRNPWKQAPQG
jgi:hypothetical protein